MPILVAARFNPSNAKLIPICHLLALLGGHHVLHVSRIRVKAWVGGLSLAGNMSSNPSGSMDVYPF